MASRQFNFTFLHAVTITILNYSSRVLGIFRQDLQDKQDIISSLSCPVKEPFPEVCTSCRGKYILMELKLNYIVQYDSFC